MCGLKPLKICAVVLSCLAFFCQTVLAQDLFINEFLAVNVNDLADEHGEYDDWLEIYNHGETAIDVGGLYLTDNLDEPLKWQIPSDDPALTTIPAKGFLLLWCDGTPSQGTLHTNFRLSSGGEAIGLYDASDARFLDSVDFGEQYSDVSRGRLPDGGKIWNFFSETTPGAANADDGEIGISPPVTFSLSGGFFSDSVTVELSCPESSADIYYTLNSSSPGLGSHLYTGPITLRKSTPVRAVAIVPQYLPSPLVTNTYFIDFPTTIPVVSLVTDSSNIWGANGIYTTSNRDRGWEKPVSIELYEVDGTAAIRQNAGIKIHAPDIRPQQSFRLYARASYGDDYFRYRIFPDRSTTEFKRLILRNAGNDGSQIRARTHMRDMVMHTLYHQENPAHITSAGRPAHVFLAGNYWGLYYIRERQDIHFIESYFGETDVDFLERAFGAPGNRYALSGDWYQFDFMKQFAINNDLNDPGHFAQMETFMDVENFRDYWIFEVFSGNYDWLNNNVRMWRPRKPGSVFRWIMWDVDHGLGLPLYEFGDPEWNTLEWAMDSLDSRTQNGANGALIRNLLENERFRNDFINRFADLLNTRLSTASTRAVVDSFVTILEPEIYHQLDRWRRAPHRWDEALVRLRSYLHERPDYVREHLMNQFHLSDTFAVTLRRQPADGGSIRINSLDLAESSWQGTYFSDVPVAISAAPRPGYRFLGWSAGSHPEEPSLQMLLEEDLDMTAYFVVDSSSLPPPIVINEINYASAPTFDTGDWIELHNAHDTSIDMSGWYFRDGNPEHRFTFPPGTIVDPNAFIILCRDSSEFRPFFPTVANVFGNMDFGFDSNGEQLSLYDRSGSLIDMVDYDSDSPWPAEPNGEGQTLELVSAFWDNTEASSWRASLAVGGTPGQQNSAVVAVADEENPLAKTIVLRQNYPNPFNPRTTIEYALPDAEHVTLAVFDVTGRKVMQLLDRHHNPGFYSLQWDGRNQWGTAVASGVYIYRLEVNGTARYRKMLLVR